MKDTHQTATAIAAYLRHHGDPITKGNVEDVLAELVVPLCDAQDFAYGDLGQVVDQRPTLGRRRARRAAHAPRAARRRPAHVELHAQPRVPPRPDAAHHGTLTMDSRDEVLQDLIAVRDALRVALPLLVAVAAKDDDWPDTLLADVAVAIENAVQRLDAAAGLMDNPSPA